MHFDPKYLVLSVAILVLSSRGSIGFEPPAKDSPPSASNIANLRLQAEQAIALLKAGDTEKAIQATNQWLKTKVSIDGINRVEVADAIDWIADRRESLGDMDSAERARQKALAIRRTMWQATDARIVKERLQLVSKLAPDDQKRWVACNIDNDRVIKLYQAGNYADAIELGKSVAKVRAEVLGRNDVDYATALNNLASCYTELQDFEQAERLHLEALKIHEKALGTLHPLYAGDLNNIALLYYTKGDLVRAESLFEQAKDVYRDVEGKKHVNYGTALSNLAHVNQYLGDYTQAEQHYAEAVASLEESVGNKHANYAQAINGFAELHYLLGEYEQAELLYVEALDIREKTLGRSHPLYATSLNNLALLHEERGDYSRSEPLQLQSLVIIEESLGKDHHQYAVNLASLALMYAAMGDFSRAEPLLLEANATIERSLGRLHPAFAGSLNKLGNYYRLTGEFARVEPLFLEAIDVYEKTIGKTHDLYGSTLNSLAMHYQTIGEYVRAEPLMLEAIAIHEQSLGRQHQQFAISLDNLGILYQCMGDYSRAEPLHKEALTIRESALGKQHPFCAWSLMNLAALHHATESYKVAESFYLRALSITRSHVEVASLIQSERGQIAMAKGVRNRIDYFLSLAVDTGTLDSTAYGELLNWKGATLARQKGWRKVSREQSIAPLFTEFQNTAMRLATLSRMTPAPDQHDRWQQQLVTLRDEKERIEKELSKRSKAFQEAQDSIEVEDVRASLPNHSALVDFLDYTRFVPGPNNERSTAPAHVRSLLAFVIRQDRPVALVDLGPVDDIDAMIDHWRKGFGQTAQSSAMGTKLREKIWAPIENLIADCDLVLLSTDGALGRLPFAALPGLEEGKFLIEEYRLATIPVAQLLPALVKRDGQRTVEGGLLVMGDVDYDAESEALESGSRKKMKGWRGSNVSAVRSDRNFGVLNATAGEIASIQELFLDLFAPEPDEIYALKQAQATEAVFRELAPKFHNLHLATHGFFADESRKSFSGVEAETADQFLSMNREQLIGGFSPGLLSGLAFSGANRKPELDKDDGILTAEEISSLSLDGVDLVVLSACETGLGKVAGGEGLLGVQRAFQVAGARSTIASLWKVDDIATRRLMERFYRNYWKEEMSKLDALREAQLYLLNNPDEIRGDARRKPTEVTASKRLSPEFWAAFSLSGDWR